MQHQLLMLAPLWSLPVSWLMPSSCPRIQARISHHSQLPWLLSLLPLVRWFSSLLFPLQTWHLWRVLVSEILNTKVFKLKKIPLCELVCCCPTFRQRLWTWHATTNASCAFLCASFQELRGHCALFLVVVTCFGNRFSLYSPGCPKTHNPPSLASGVLGF